MSERLTDDELADLGRLEAAVRGKWSCVYDGDEPRATLRTGSFSLTSEVSGLFDPRVHELSLACAARNALPSLLAEVRELRAAVSTEARINVAQLDELYELRAFEAQIKAVK